MSNCHVLSWAPRQSNMLEQIICSHLRATWIFAMYARGHGQRSVHQRTPVASTFGNLVLVNETQHGDIQGYERLK